MYCWVCAPLSASPPDLSEWRGADPRGWECWGWSLWYAQCVISLVFSCHSSTFTKCLTLSCLENMGYINGQVQPEGKYLHTQKPKEWDVFWACSPSSAGAFPEAPTAVPSLAYPAPPAHLPAQSSPTPDVGPAAGVEDLPEPAGPASIPLDSEAAPETLGLTQQPDDPQQLPRQIHIQQHLKLHFHNQGEVCRGHSSDANPLLDLQLDCWSLYLLAFVDPKPVNSRQPLLPASIIIRNCATTFTALTK